MANQDIIAALMRRGPQQRPVVTHSKIPAWQRMEKRMRFESPETPEGSDGWYAERDSRVIDYVDPSEFYRLPLDKAARQMGWPAPNPQEVQGYGNADDDARMGAWDANMADPMGKPKWPQGGPQRPPLAPDMQGGGGVPEIKGGERGDSMARPGTARDSKLREGDQKTIIYLERGANANHVLNDSSLAAKLTDWDESMADNFGSLGRWYQTPEYQVARRAANEFLAAVLRKDTGAAITSEEFDLYGPMFLPMPGDKPEVLTAKAQARAVALRALERGLGEAGPMASDIYADIERNPPPVPGGGGDEALFKKYGLE